MNMKNTHVKINSNGTYEIPAFIDMHCHLRDPGFEYKEDIATGTAAAKAGGYHAVVAMPNTKPVTDAPAVLDYIADKARKVGSCRVYPTASITLGQNGTKLSDFDELHKHGAVAFTDDGKPVSDSSLMYEAMKLCSERGYLIISHPEELILSSGGAVNEGDISSRMNLKGIPNAAEDIAIAREIILAEATGCRLHIAHISTKGGVQLVREAKARGVNVTCETCPHYFSLCDEDVETIGANAKMNPPLRSKTDVSAVIEGIKDGTIDCISTDHAPHSPEEKNLPLGKALNGIIGLQTAFPAAVTYLVKTGHITIERLTELMSLNPAKILGIDVDSIGTNTVSLDTKTIITEDMFKSKSHNSPYIGKELYGSVLFTINS